PVVTVFRGVLARKASLPDVGLPLAAGLQFIAPAIALAIQPAAGRELPLRLGRQSFARPLGVRHDVLPAHLHYRMLCPPLEIAPGPFRVAPARSRHVAPPGQMIR